MSTNLAITSMFTAASLLRGYFMRRFFNARLHVAIHNFVRRIYVNKAN